MTYTLHQLAVGSYDLALDGIIIGSVVQDIAPGGSSRGWRAELLDELTPDQWPIPFRGIEPPFRTLEAAMAWLNGAAIVEGHSQQSHGFGH
ncbi:hypothetical protein [Methylobacterium sp. V23]|uniref:hypothetical protein n=1 Tax=Methylobacterium sp. V23 TaxID=2044878 RepID=UPI000CDA1847|nr:hypothetical protein [Methylobacterium sp. V23]POR40393.1 hypothetical protein CRT23_24005 [Methylobacterium sp. V23]